MATVTLPEFADRVGEIMPVIMRQFIRQESSEFYKSKITLPQFAVLGILERTPESNMTELAHVMNVTTAAVTGIVDRLVRDGYVERMSDPGDRRIIKVRLTTKGSGVVKDMEEKRKRVTMKIFGTISQKEREEYLKILEHIRDHLS